MKHPILCSLAVTLATLEACAEALPQAPLRAADGPLVALWQMAANPNKPYIAQLYAPGEPPMPLLIDSPPDHFHHHGLMFALSADDTDFWSEKGIKNAGRQEVAESVATPAGDGFSQSLRWLATDGTNLLDEARSVRVRATGTGAEVVHWLDWQSSLSPAVGRASVRLSGSHYFGLGMRFLPAWANKSEFLWAATVGQTVVRGDEKLTPGAWAAVRCEIDGHPVTVLMIDHPANPRPALWFTMGRPFCYLSAALGLDSTPANLAAGERWTLRYGLALISGPADAARLAKLAAEWLASNPFPTVEKTTPAKP
ncbi:MAG: DUF6807 family protein [Verrucomicrobiota bacterium]